MRLPPGPLVLALVTGLVAASGPALAAGLSLTSKRLTTYTKQLTAVTCTLTAAPNPSLVETDAYVREDAPVSNNGTATTISIRSNSGARRYGLVRFDPSQCSIPAAAIVLSATLKLVLTTAPGASRTYQVFRSSGAWSETSVTWTTRPGFQSSSAIQTTLSGAITNAATNMTVADGSAFPAAPFTVTVDSETIRVGAKSGNTLSGLTRGYFGTVAAAHLAGAAVTLLSPTASVATGTAAGVTLSANVVYDVQAFLAGATNNGWLVADADETTNATGALGARENAAAANRPQLVIAYAT